MPSGRRSTNTAVGLIVHNHPEYLEDEAGVHPSRKPQRTSMIAEENPTMVPVKHTDFLFSPDLASELPEYTRTNDHAIKLVNDYPSHPQVLPSFLTGSRTDAFDCAPEVSITWPWRTGFLNRRALHLDPQDKHINGLIHKRNQDCGWLWWGWW